MWNLPSWGQGSQTEKGRNKLNMYRVYRDPYSGVLLSSVLLHGALILLSVSWIKGFWGNSTSLQTLELCLLCNATENERGPVPGVIGDGEATAQGRSSRIGGHPSEKKST